MTQASVVRTRLRLWMDACEGWDLQITPPLTAESLESVPKGGVELVAIGPQAVTPRVSLTVSEFWSPGPDPQGDRRLEAEGCHLVKLSWHLQTGEDGAAEHAQRLDVIERVDADHPRIHRHPYGCTNEVRVAAELPPPAGWLPEANEAIGGLLLARFETRHYEDIE